MFSHGGRWLIGCEVIRNLNKPLLKVEIVYRDFYDVPRMFIVRYEGRQILFDCKFDENADEYSETYKVYLLPGLGEEVLKGPWNDLPALATHSLGEVPVKDVTFDPSLRKEIDTSILDSLINRSPRI